MTKSKRAGSHASNASPPDFTARLSDSSAASASGKSPQEHECYWRTLTRFDVAYSGRLKT
jgi:hypothetical protein